MTFLAPMFLAVGAAAVAALVALHFITRHRPPKIAFPTARFVPENAARITARSFRLTDRRLLVLRAIAVASAAIALAGPSRTPQRDSVARVLLLDATRAVASADEVRDSARAWLRESDVLIMFDSVPRLLDGQGIARLDAYEVSGAQGSLTTALIAAYHQVALLRERADSVELVLISPLVEEQLDAATMAVRGLHGGRMAVLRTTAALSEVLAAPVSVRAAQGDPVADVRSLLRAPDVEGELRGTGYVVRVVRSGITAEDSVWARGEGHVLVHWPAEAQAALMPREFADTTGAVIAGDAVLLASMPRAVVLPQGERVAARWADGEAAAIERRTGNRSCIRDVAVPVSAAGDLVLRPSFLRLADELAGPCGGRSRLAPLADSVMEQFAGTGPLMSADAFGRETRRAPLAPWLLGIALLAALLELPVRRTARS